VRFRPRRHGLADTTSRPWRRATNRVEFFLVEGRARDAGLRKRGQERGRSTGRPAILAMDGRSTAASNGAREACAPISRDREWRPRSIRRAARCCRA